MLLLVSAPQNVPLFPDFSCGVEEQSTSFSIIERFFLVVSHFVTCPEGCLNSCALSHARVQFEKKNDGRRAYFPPAFNAF